MKNTTPSTFSLRETFDLLDKDKTGTISYEELKKALEACDQKVNDKDLKESLRKRGYDPINLELSYKSFEKFMGAPSKLTLSEVQKFFHALDLDASGYLTAAELRHVMTNMSLGSDDAIMDEMISMYDLDGNGQVQFDEFVELVKALGVEVEDDFGEEEDEAQPADDTEEEEEDPEVVITSKIDQFPKDVQDIMKMFDFKGTGEVTSSDLVNAAELLKVQKMSSAKDPEANPALHWKKGREKKGLGSVVYKANHIALIVEDVGRSASFYANVMGFQQIRRPNFDRHGAWFTMGNLELHLIKGTPIVHSGDDLIVGHISIETYGIDKVPGLLRKMGVPFRQNVSVPKGGTAAGEGTNSSSSSKKIVRQYFFRDPDGYYLEVCNCDVLTSFCLGEKTNLDTYEEGAKPITVEDAGKLIGIMQRWSSKSSEDQIDREDQVPKALATDMTPKSLAGVLGYKAAKKVDEEMLQSLFTRQSIYGDICQNMTQDELKETLLYAGNDVPAATRVMKLKADAEGTRRVQAPAFYEDGTTLVKPKLQNLDDDL